jgi:hypothetical protein
MQNFSHVWPGVVAEQDLGRSRSEDIFDIGVNVVPAKYRDGDLYVWGERAIRREVILGQLKDDELRGHEEFKLWHNSIQNALLIWNAKRYWDHWGEPWDEFDKLSADQLRGFPCRMEGGSGLDSYTSRVATKSLKPGGYYLVMWQTLQMLYDYGQDKDRYDVAAQKLRVWHLSAKTELRERTRLLESPIFPFYYCPQHWLDAGGPAFTHGGLITPASLIEIDGGERNLQGQRRWFITLEDIQKMRTAETLDLSAPSYCSFTNVVEAMAGESLPQWLNDAGISFSQWKTWRGMVRGDSTAHKNSPTTQAVAALAAKMRGFTTDSLCELWSNQYGAAQLSTVNNQCR